MLDGAAREDRRRGRGGRETARAAADDVPLVALGGAGEALVARVAERLGRPLVRPEHPEVLSSIGAALSLVRVELDRNGMSALDVPALATEAEAACIAAGAAPASITVETAYDETDRILRAVATGAAALETGAVGAEPADDRRRLEAAADALELAPADLTLLAANDFYRVYSENGSGRVAVVDGLGAVPLAEDARRVFAGEGTEFVERLRRELREHTRSSASRRCCRACCSCAARASSTSPTRAAPEDVAAAARARARGPRRHRRRRPRALMSLYRQAGRRSGWLAAAVVVALLVGFGIGFAVSRATAEEPTVEEAVASVQEEAGETADALELVAIHYRTTEAAAGQQLQRAEESFDEVRPDLQLLSPEETADAGQAIERLAALVNQSASADEVERAAEEARAAVRQAAGLR